MAFHPLAVAIATYSPKWLVAPPNFLVVADGTKVARAARMGSLSVFLASDDSAHVTGIELMVDGGVAQY